MSVDRIIRVGAVASILSGLVWLVLTPFMATIGICSGRCASWLTQPFMIRTLGRIVADRGWLSHAPPDVLYFGYGRYFFLVYGFLILGLLALHRAHQQRLPRQHPLAYRAYRLLFGSLMIAMLGDFASYGIGVYSEGAWRYGFGVEVAAWLGIMLGGLLYGIAILRQRAIHPAIGWLLILAALLLPATFFDRFLVQYAPNAQLLPLAVIWPVIGVYLLVSQRPNSSLSGSQIR